MPTLYAGHTKTSKVLGVFVYPAPFRAWGIHYKTDWLIISFIQQTMLLRLLR